MLRFRRAHTADVDAIVELVESAYRGEVSRAGWTTEADLLDGRRTGPDEVRPVVEADDKRILLAEDDGALVGTVLLAGERDGVVYLGMLSVRPTLQARGVGDALMREAERVVSAEMSGHTIRMRVFPQRESLIAWYARRGYHATGAREPFPYGDPRFGVPKREDLEFIVLAKTLSEPRSG